MYQYPYGDSQQLNLDWIINKLRELESSVLGGLTLQQISEILITLTYSTSSQYRRYDYCFKDGKLYRALNDNIGGFDASDWMEVRLGDDLSILTRLINTTAITDVFFDTSGTEGKLQQKYGASYHDIVAVDYTPVQNSKRPLSSNAGYDLNRAITKAKNISQISDLGTDSFYFNASANITLTPTDIIIPLYSKGVFITTGNDGVLFAITSTGEEITAYRNGSTWTNPKKKTSTRLLGKQIAIYGDSWATDTYGSLGASYLTALTGKTVHVSASGMQTMKQTYDNLWDSFNADIYIIQAGLNDKVQNVGATEFIKAVKDFVSAIRTVNANAEIYFITPQMTHVANQYQNCFPNEFYRIILWRLSGIYNFSCINSLKWQDVKLLSDNTHPTAVSIPLIANHIINALENYGDEETHDTEFSNLGRADNQLLFYCEGGIFFFLTQSVNVEATTANYIELAFNIGTQFMYADTVTTNRTGGSFTRMYYDATTPNYIKFSVASLPVGNTFTNNGTKLIVSIVDLQIPISAW